jgi:hypothetical protein
MVDRAMLLRRLAHAADRIEMGVRYIAKQRGIIDRLEAGGHDSSDARQILAYLMELHATNIAEHKRIMEEN